MKKIRAVGIIVIFLCSIFISATGGYSEEIIQFNDYDIEICDTQENVLVSCSTYGLPCKYSKEIEIPYSEAKGLFEKINKLAEEIAYNPSSDETEKLQNDIISDAKEYNLIPEDISLEELQPRFFNKLDLKHSKKGILPVIGNRGIASFCNFATAGEGSQFPIMILPRMIPILLTPIPRAFLHWTAYEGVTTCGSYLTGTGFIAGGMQRGTALGFWGIGFSVFLPPFRAYGFIGYALFATCTAELMEPWPPNYPPEATAIFPGDGAENVAISTSELSFQITDENGDLMDFTVTSNPDIGFGSDSDKPGGTYSIPISGLEGTEKYTWYIEVSDGEKTTDATFSFETEPVAPIVTDPNPEDSERYVPISISQLNFHLKDPQGDLMDYTVETSPDIGSGSGIDVGEGTYSIDVNGLDYSQEYKWFVNVTDGENWKHKAYSFQADHKKVFDPFDEGWQYRKKIIINHTKVIENFSNFPVLISTIDTDLRNKVQDRGDDILFMNSPGVATRLYHELENFDGSNGELIAWVHLPNLSSDQDTIFYLYYGNPNCCNQQAPEFVWDSYYVGVWHLNEVSGNIIDSTGTKDGIVVGSPTYQQSAEKIHKSIYFDGSNTEYFDITNDMYKFYDEDVTLEAWVYYSEHRDYYDTPVDLGDTDRYPVMYLQKIRSGYAPLSGYLQAKESFGSSGSGSNLAYSNDGGSSHIGHWIYQVGRFERGVETSLYLNGIKQDYTGSCENNNLAGGSNFKARIGSGVKTSGYYPDSIKGYIDEVRISKGIARSEAWISTNFNNQNNPQGFLSFGPEETGP